METERPGRWPDRLCQSLAAQAFGLWQFNNSGNVCKASEIATIDVDQYRTAKHLADFLQRLKAYLGSNRGAYSLISQDGFSYSTPVSTQPIGV